MKDIKLAVTIDTDGKQTPSVETGDPMPDLSSRFAMNFSENWIGQNHLKIVVNTKGLLTSTDSDMTSSIADILKNLAKTAGYITALADKSTTSQPSKCPPGQKVVKFLDPKQVLTTPLSLCNFSVKIERLGFSDKSLGSESFKQKKLFGSWGPELGWSGLFYKQELPYRVTFTDNASTDNAFEFIAFSPNESPVSFMPASKTFFSDNIAKFTLTDGILTSAEQTTKGEIVALSALPADVISAYFEAIGSMFTHLNTNATNQKSALDNEQALAVTEIKKQVCLAAIAANNPTGKSGDALKMALDNITKACQ